MILLDVGGIACHDDEVAVRAVFVNAREQRSLGAGDIVFTEGEPGHEMFGVISGAVELRRDGASVGRVEPGGTFGEMAIVSDAPRSLTAVAVEPTVVAVIDQRTFMFLVHETPLFALNVMQSLADRIRQLDERV